MDFVRKRYKLCEWQYELGDASTIVTHYLAWALAHYSWLSALIVGQVFVNLLEICLASNWMVIKKTSSNKSKSFQQHHLESIWQRRIFATWRILSKIHSQCSNPQNSLNILPVLTIWVGFSPGSSTLYLQYISILHLTRTHSHVVVAALFVFPKRLPSLSRSPPDEDKASTSGVCLVYGDDKRSTTLQAKNII